ncbi:paralemmin-3 [Erinaceus europaeus]|uniref:Paralemmin-3 n=1 Tax=Erinaceus europaeus TaxID=9365 RepID=A0ABM3WPD6_ERIEU|nr:paralemmin-3 [Erinaceus europaeus]
MALESQLWAPATFMPMAESSLYRQRLEVIAEKRRLQEGIRAARRELEEEKLRVERLKRKNLRERWLMDGAAEGPKQQGPLSEDPQPPQDHRAQVRIRHLEDSLFTLQSQLQLLQAASTGALHKPSARPWRRQGPRPLSQPLLEATPEAGQTDQEKRASLPLGVGDMSPESPSPTLELRDEAARRGPLEANGPRPPAAAGEGGCMVEVVWAGLRDPGVFEAAGPTLEARVEALVQEAIGERPEAGSPELPCWVKGAGGMEVVWEGVGGPEAGDTEAPAGSRSPRLQEGSFIWVEKTGLSEDWEELPVGSQRPGDEIPLGESWEERRRREEGGGEGKRDATEEVLVAEREGGEKSQEERGGEKLQTEREGDKSWEEREGSEGALETQPEGGEEGDMTHTEQTGEKGLEVEKTLGMKDPPKTQENEVTQTGSPPGGPREEPRPEEKLEGSLEEKAASSKPHPTAEGPSGDTAPLPAETPGPLPQAPECQPLLEAEGARAAVPSYAPARQPEPGASPEGQEPKQKTCQCCVLM